MSSEYTLTGRNGKFVVGTTLVSCITDWSVNPKLRTSSEWSDSCSAGFTNRAAGAKDCTFTANGKFYTNAEVYDLFQPEDIAIAVLWLNNVNLYWDFPRALCNDFSLVINVDTQEVCAWTSAWGADGQYFYPGEPGATARTLP